MGSYHSIDDVKKILVSKETKGISLKVIDSENKYHYFDLFGTHIKMMNIPRKEWRKHK